MDRGDDRPYPTDEYKRLAAEGEELRRQEKTALASDVSSDTYRRYVVRLRAHIDALAAYLGTDER